jgi:hypothetical protein
MDAGAFEYFMRIIGRLGFVVVLIGVYRLWHLPVLRRHSSQFFWLVVTLFVLNVAIGIIESVFDSIASYNLSLYFNVISTWILAIHLNYRAHTIIRRVGHSKIEKFTFEVNQKIEELKNENR